MTSSLLQYKGYRQFLTSPALKSPNLNRCIKGEKKKSTLNWTSSMELCSRFPRWSIETLRRMVWFIYVSAFKLMMIFFPL